MAVQAEPQYFTKARRAGRVVVEEPPKLDLEAYIANYRGRTRFERLLLIGTSSSYLFLEALKAAIAEAKQGTDVQRYENAVSCLREIAPNDTDATPDLDWIDRMKKQVKGATDKMELELKGYKNNLIKESIRMGYDDLGHHYHRIGELSKSNKAYSQMRDFCTTNSHIVIMNMHLINVCIDQHSWFAAQNHVQRIRGQSGNQKYHEAEKNSAKLSAASGLTYMAQAKYKEAAEEFLSTNPRMSQTKLDDPADEESYNEVLTPNDIAVYGGLCALASMTREELQKQVLDNSGFRNYLELEPHIRRAISYFVSSKYSACLSILDSYKADYLLDIYLQRHIPQLYYEVRSKAIQQYFIPFSCVTFSALATAFNTDEPNIEIELSQMIKRGNLDARLDLVDRVLLGRKVDNRSEVHAKALATAEEYERTAHLRLLRMGLLNAGLEIKATKGLGNVGSGSSQDGGSWNGGVGDLMSGEGQDLRSGSVFN